MSSIGKYVDWACATRWHGTITVSGFGNFHKNCLLLWGKNVSKTNLGSTIHYTYTSTNISDFVWFQRSCGSMKSVSSFSSIETGPYSITPALLVCYKNTVVYKQSLYFLLQKISVWFTLIMSGHAVATIWVSGCYKI